MNKKIFIIGILLAILVLLVFLLLAKNSPQTNLKTNSSQATISLRDLGGPITIKGWVRCLKPKTVNNNCIIGLEDAQGVDYGLLTNQGKLLNPIKLNTGSAYRASGHYILTPKFLQNYQIQKTIKLNP